MISRRNFLGTASAVPLLKGPPRLRAEDTGEKGIAIIATEWAFESLAQQVGDAFLMGYPYEGKWHQPRARVRSVYVERDPTSALIRQRSDGFGMVLYPTIAETLRCGKSSIGVDAVLVLADSGSKPRSTQSDRERCDRYRYFQQIVKIFREEQTALPLYFSHFLSDYFKESEIILSTSQKIGSPLMTGSTTPLTWRMPECDLPYGRAVKEALVVTGRDSETAEFEALEAMQGMLERRRGGETGVRSVRLLKGDQVWQAASERRWSQTLLEAALSRSDKLLGITLKDARPQDLVNSGVLPGIVDHPRACIIEYVDGLRATLLQLRGAIGDLVFSARLAGRTNPLATQFLTAPMISGSHSSCLVTKIEAMVTTGVSPCPAERGWLVRGVLEKSEESGVRRGEMVRTPELKRTYRVPKQSQYIRS